MGFMTQKTIKKVQLFFKDNHHFEFINRALEYSSLVIKEGEMYIMGWKHFYSTELPFAGYKGMRPGMVTLGFTRDIILDPFDCVHEGTEIGQKPRKAGEQIKTWIAKIAESQRQTYRVKRKTNYLTNKIIWAEIALIVILAIGWVIRYSTM